MTKTNSALEALTDTSLETCILGQIVLYDGWQLYASLGITPSDFFRPVHQELIGLSQKVYEAGNSPDAVLLRQAGGDVVALSKVQQDTVPVREDNARWMLGQLKDLSRARRIYYANQNLELALGKKQGKAPALVEEHLKAIHDIVSESTESGFVMDAAQQHKALVDLTEARKARKSVWLGLLAIDQVIDGLSSGEVLGLAARPGVGKTLWLGRYMQAVTEMEIPALMFSLEMPTAQIATRLAQANWAWSRQGTLDRVEQGVFTMEAYREKFSKLHICDRAGLSVAEMEAITSRVKKQHDIGLVLIDHLGLVGGHKSLRPYERTSLNSQDIKNLAKRCDVPVVLAIQVSRDAGGDGSIPLTLSSTRDSGVTEEVVDYLIGLHRPDRSLTLNSEERTALENVVIARILKNRHGQVGDEAGVHINAETLEWTERLRSNSYRM